MVAMPCEHPPGQKVTSEAETFCDYRRKTTWRLVSVQWALCKRHAGFDLFWNGNSMSRHQVHGIGMVVTSLALFASTLSACSSSGTLQIAHRVSLLDVMRASIEAATEGIGTAQFADRPSLHALANPLQKSLVDERDAFLRCARTQDYQVGVAAFLEKKRARFAGCGPARSVSSGMACSASDRSRAINHADVHIPTAFVGFREIHLVATQIDPP